MSGQIKHLGLYNLLFDYGCLYGRCSLLTSISSKARFLHMTMKWLTLELLSVVPCFGAGSSFFGVSSFPCERVRQRVDELDALVCFLNNL